MFTQEGQLKRLAVDFRAMEHEARRKERDAKIEAETWIEAWLKIEDALGTIEQPAAGPGVNGSALR